MASFMIVQNLPFPGQPGAERMDSSESHFPKLNPIMEEEISNDEEIRDCRDTIKSSNGVDTDQSSSVELPSVPDAKKEVVLTEHRLLEALGLSCSSEKKPTGLLLDSVRSEVKAALEELRSITTHDDNLEKQYKETVAENTKLRNDLDKAWREIRHLKGQLSIMKMTAPEIRQERARMQEKHKQRIEREKQVQLERNKFDNEAIQVLSVAERARTVNARGEYIDHLGSTSRHARGSTYPTSSLTKHTPTLSTLPPAKLKKLQPLPPSLPGCTCSVCSAKQSMGALTLGKGVCLYQQTAGQITKSGQQILLGDRVIIKGERLGSVCYIGKLDFDIYEHIYVGVQLDMPVGNSDGSLKGRRYFQCPPNHGVFVRSSQIICVTGRKPVSGSTALPRVREKLPTGLQLSREASRASKTPTESCYQTQNVPGPLAHSSPTMSQVKKIVESELAMLKERDPNELADDSVVTMSKRIKVLSEKHQRSSKPEPTELPTIIEPQTTDKDNDDTLSHSDLPPRPLTPQPSTPSPITSETYCPATPLERTLFELLSDKDLGSTGFVTANELAAVLMQLEPEKALSAEQVDELFTQLGISSEDGVGIAYHSLLAVLIQAIEEFSQTHEE